MSNQANLSQLPEETISEIFSNFNEEDPADSSALRACALVCQALLSPSQAILFSKIFLFSKETHTLGLGRRLNTQRIEDFYAILQNKPHVAGYVRELHLGFNHGDTDWVSQGHFIHIMECIHENNSIQTLRLYAMDRSDKTLVKETSALERYVAPLVNRLEISNLQGLPTSLLTSCANLKKLRLMQATFDSKVCTGNGPKPQLEHLEYDSSPGIINIIIRNEDFADSIPDVSRLRILKTYPLWPENLMQLRSLLRSCAETLEELYLKVSVYYIPFSLLSINLSRMLSLRVLECHIKVGSSWDGTDPFPDLSNFLGTIPGENYIKRITLTVQIEIENTDNLEPYFDAQWELLDKQLTRISSGKPLALCLDLVYFPTQITATSDNAYDAEENAFLEECKSTFDRVVYEKHLTLRDTPQITVDVLHNIFRPSDEY